jgi:long-chain acyl-CoA synthetase
MAYKNLHFCWHGIISTDVDKASAFYPETIGWKLQKFPMGDEEATMLVANEIPRAHIIAPPMDGVPSHWNNYLRVEDVDATAQAAIDMVETGPSDCSVSYLPLSHIAEQMFSILAAVSAGYSIWLCPAVDQLLAYLVEARPTLFLAVPRVWEKFKAKLETQLADATGAKAKIVSWSMRQGLEGGRTMMATGDPEGLDGLKYRVANKLFFSKLQAKLGLDRLKMAVTGAAPIGKDVLEFFLSCGIIIHEVYGQSEDTGPTTFNNPFPGQRKHGTVGLPLPGVEVKIADDGEILVRGRNVCAGYYKMPEATAETIIDGWLYSGDIGEFDDQGFLRITDRKKDIIITAGGKNVAPQNIEKLMKSIAGVSQCVVIGDTRKFLSALFTIDPEAGPALA